MKKAYPNIKRYFEYLDSHSENGLVTSDVKSQWCLGDRCTPEEIKIPCPLVNTYFYVRSINGVLELKDILALSECEVEKLQVKREELKEAEFVFKDFESKLNKGYNKIICE